MTGEDRMDKQVMRAQFELAVKRAAVDHFGYRDGDALLKTVLEKRGNGSYCVEWVNGFAIGWQASREAVEVELPSRPHASEEEQERMTDYEIGLGHGGCEEWDKIRKKIKEQGLKVKP